MSGSKNLGNTARRRAIALALGGLCLTLGVACAVALERDTSAFEVSLSPVYTITQAGNRIFVEISSPSLY
ncbi:hypothetical protein HT136_16785 [Novosphingobium profundi]|uniref:hypothetical protein n=1 Tax=Novosphingobium profundi TaxID=1774954 RepID=UPI001BDA1C63|nr:hypothetical protein [Novosphingobium profundi]MBT0670023.1 hypothetical protein [Novosphingobium profundi]